MKKYILLYGDKKPEDNICITNMFEHTKAINLGWTDFDYNYNKKIIDKEIEEGIEQIIFSGLEIGWDKLIKDIKQENPDLIIKVICNTQDSLLYYEYERENFFTLLELSKQGIVSDIAFFRKSQYETYKNLGYNCSYLKENYILKEEKKLSTYTQNEKLNIGIYPLNYTWDKNIFNQLCIGKMLENCNINYNALDERMDDFLETMNILHTQDKIKKIEEDELIQKMSKNDAIVSTSFTDYLHPVFWISMELGIPCLVGNHTDFLEENVQLKQYVVTTAEDNAIINAELLKKMIQNKEKIHQLYKEWKQEYNKEAEKQLIEFIDK